LQATSEGKTAVVGNGSAPSLSIKLADIGTASLFADIVGSGGVSFVKGSTFVSVGFSGRGRHDAKRSSLGSSVRHKRGKRIE